MLTRYFSQKDAPPIPFNERGREKLSAWLATSFSLNGLVALPPLPPSFTRSEAHASTSILQKLQKHIDHAALSTDPRHLLEASGEPLFLRLLRAHDGLPASPIAALFAENIKDFQHIAATAKTLGFETTTPDTIVTDKDIPLLVFHPGRCQQLVGEEARPEYLEIGAGTTWKQLKHYADQVDLWIPCFLSNRFETPLAAALAGVFKVHHLFVCDAITVQAKIELERGPKTEQTYWFPTQSQALSAFQSCAGAEGVFYTELVPHIDLKIGTLLNYWSFGLSWPKQQRYGLRLIVDQDAHKTRPVRQAIHKIIKQNQGRKWPVGTLLRAREKAAALLYCGAAEVSLQVPLDYDPADPEGLNIDIAAAESVLEDAAKADSPYHQATPITSISALSTKYQRKIIFGHVIFPRTPGQSARQWRDIYAKALRRLNRIFAPIPPQKIAREAPEPSYSSIKTTQKPLATPDDTATSPEWQAIRDALLSDFGPVGSHTDPKQPDTKVTRQKQDHPKGNRS